MVLPLARQHGEHLWYVVTDHLGTPRELVSETGEVAWRKDFDDKANDTKATMEADMTENTSQKAYKLIVLALIAVVLTASQTVDAKKIRVNEKTLWELLALTYTHINKGIDGVQTIWTAPIRRIQYRGLNTNLMIFSSDPVHLKGGLTLHDLEIRVDKDTPTRIILMTFEIKGRCIAPSGIQHHYPEIKITGVPTGHSLGEETTYSISGPGPRLSFGFPESNRGCLRSVMIDPSAASD